MAERLSRFCVVGVFLPRLRGRLIRFVQNFQLNLPLAA